MTIQKTTIKEQIYTIVRRRILSGELRLGEKINIMALSAELNVSNTPVREALSMLERDGLIKVTPNAGPRVIEYSPELFASVEKAVEALMLGALELIIHTGKKAALCDMLREALAHQLETHRTAPLHEYTRTSMKFDGCFIRCTENDYLLKMYLEVMDIFYLVALYDQSIRDEERLIIIEEHRKILLAIEDDKYEEARYLIMKHYGRMNGDSAPEGKQTR